MEEQNLNAFKETYDKFRNKLINDITNQQMSSNSEDCCLIDELFFSDYINPKITNRPLNNIPTLKIDEFLIKDFAKIQYYIKNNKKFKLINKLSIDLIFKSKLNFPFVQYYGGNNKIIIVFKGKKDKPLLLINPLDENQLKKKHLLFL